MVTWPSAPSNAAGATGDRRRRRTGAHVVVEGVLDRPTGQPGGADAVQCRLDFDDAVAVVGADLVRSALVPELAGEEPSSPGVGPAWWKSTNRCDVVFSITTIVRPPPSPDAADANEAPPIAIATSAPTPAVISSFRTIQITISCFVTCSWPRSSATLLPSSEPVNAPAPKHQLSSSGNSSNAFFPARARPGPRSRHHGGGSERPSRSGQTSRALVTAVRSDPPTQAAIAKAEIVLIGIGQADLAAGDAQLAAGECRAEACYASDLSQFRGNIELAAGEIRHVLLSPDVVLRAITPPNVVASASDVVSPFLTHDIGVYRSTSMRRSICRAMAMNRGRCVDVLRASTVPAEPKTHTPAPG